MPPISRESYPIIAGVALGFLFLVSHLILFRAPETFPVGKMVIIPEGLTLQESAELLREKHVITSPTFFSLLASLFSREKIIAGGYFFEKPLSVFAVAIRTTTGDYNVDLLRLTFFEGMNVKEMAHECAQVLPGCDEQEFIQLGKSKEGYLFPDTYFLLPGATAAEVISAAQKNFERKIALVQDKIDTFGKPLEDVITMASIIEGEARKDEDRRVVAGILWERIRIDMPLQVDAAFKYVNGKTTFDLSLDDLREDSPYNTYTNKGLPPTPIGNPGLGTIEAAVTPIETPYLYYLTDNTGMFHYAKTHNEHVRNKNRYLK